MSKDIQGIKLIIIKSIGFTLIELIIVFTVLSLLSATGIASYVSYSRSQAIANDASSLIASINLARTNAISQVKPSVCTNFSLQSYDIKLTLIGTKNKYVLNVICNGTHQVSPPLPLSYTLSSNIAFDTTTVNKKTTISRISYPVLTDKVIVYDSSGNPYLNGETGKIVLKGYGQTRTISIDSSNGQTQITNP